MPIIKQTRIPMTEDCDYEERMPKAKQAFISKLKSFLTQEKGPYILDQLTMTIDTSLESETVGAFKSNGTLQVDLDLEIDLIKMIHFDQFLSDNFIRCFFRYYPKLPLYIKELYIALAREQQSLQLKEQCYNQVTLQQNIFYKQEIGKLETKLVMIEKTMSIKLNLRLTQFPYALAQVNPTALQCNSIMRNHGQLVSIKLAQDIILNV